MCKKFVQTALSVMTAEEPALVNILTVTNLINTPNGQAAMTAYNTTITLLQNWKKGSPTTEVIQALSDFQALLTGLQPLIPGNYVTYLNLIIAAVVIALGLFQGNSPAPVALGVEAMATPEEATAMYQAHITLTTQEKVRELVPDYNFNFSPFWFHHSPAWQFANAWNNKQAKNPQPGILPL